MPQGRPTKTSNITLLHYYIITFSPFFYTHKLKYYFYNNIFIYKYIIINNNQEEAFCNNVIL